MYVINLNKNNNISLFKVTTQHFQKLTSVFLLLIFISGIHAATFTVDRTDDNLVSSCTPAANDCTLRGAITAANTANANDTIDFDAAIFASSQTILLTSEIIITSTGTLNINGTGANLLTISGNNPPNDNRIFTIKAGVNITISDLTVSDGKGNSPDFPGFGGGIFNRGNLTLINCAVDNNRTLTGTNGGGIYNISGGIVIIENSTISNNIGDNGGGGIVNSGTMTITNSTISGNTATSGDGGGIINIGTLNATAITVANNSATSASGGGIYIAFGTYTSGNSIYADNLDNGSAPDFSGTFTSNGYNLIESTNGTTINMMSNEITGIDPMLGALNLNAGTTKTHSLLPGSPAIDAGNSFGLTTDQRGFMRPVDISTVMNGSGDLADIGAVEVMAPSAALVTVGGRVLSPFGRGVPQATVSMTDQNGEIFVSRTNVFGYYRFVDVEVGQTLVISVFSKRYQFSQQIVSLAEGTDTLNFTANFR
jgi:hypothetical protein